MGTTERQWKGGAAWRERSVYTELTQLNVKQLYSIASTEIHIVVRVVNIILKVLTRTLIQQNPVVYSSMQNDTLLRQRLVQ